MPPPPDRVKKPSPLSAMSSDLPVWATLPWANCWATRCRRTPAPMVLLDRPCAEAANTSPNWPRDCLKPVLLELAMLLEVMLRSADAAFMPLSEIRKLMVCSLEGRSARRADARRSADAVDRRQRDAAHAGEVEEQAVGFDRHAVHARAGADRQQVGVLGRGIAGAGDGAEAVAAGGDGVARFVAAVPLERRRARGRGL